MTEIRSLGTGFRMPVHKCEPRSAIALATVTVFTQPDSLPPLNWHHQLAFSGGHVTVAIRFCPFCGVELDLEHFE